jgi:uncharacterized protein
VTKKRIINDPLYGFITIPNELIYLLIQHPHFQRLRHIRQLGLTEFIYPGATHSRFQHALGAMHVMGCILENLKAKGIEISKEEHDASQIAILLHDIGHGPFSHALEKTLLPGVKHESISYQFIQSLNRELNGALDLALKIFRNAYERKFFYQLVSSQLDADRLDYLHRDSFYSGVIEGTIGIDRIITMLNVKDGQLVVDEKGIYSIENFLHARRLMYWQVYLHKTSVSAERLLVNLIRRAKYLAQSGEALTASDPLKTFLVQNYSIDLFRENSDLLNTFGQLDDNDVWGAIKIWRTHRDPILSTLCEMILNRNLFRIILSNDPISKIQIEEVKKNVCAHYNLLQKDGTYLFSHGTVSNEAYVSEGQMINVLMKNGKTVDIAQASDLPTIKAISKIVKKSYLCWPKNVSLPN